MGRNDDDFSGEWITLKGWGPGNVTVWWHHGLLEVQHLKAFSEIQVRAVSSGKRGVAFEVIFLPGPIPDWKLLKTSNLTRKLKKTPNKSSLCGLYLIECPGSRSPCSGMQRFWHWWFPQKQGFLVTFLEFIWDRKSSSLRIPLLSGCQALCSECFLFTFLLYPHSSHAGKMMGPHFLCDTAEVPRGHLHSVHSPQRRHCV